VFIINTKDSAEQNITNTATMDGWPCGLNGDNKILYSAREEEGINSLFAICKEKQTHD
jgi:hypothetical protein